MMWEKAVADFYMKSSDRNGIPAQSIIDNYSRRNFISKLIEGIENRRVFIQDSRVTVNRHIHRMRISPEYQVELIRDFSPENVCVYPSKSLLIELGYQDKIEQSSYFEKVIYEGYAELDFCYFMISTIDRYMHDPRYVIFWGSTQGSISIKDDALADPNLPETAKIVLESFGLAHDRDGRRFLCAPLRYLAKLNEDQQGYWKSFLVEGEFKPARPYFRSSIIGEFPDSISVLSAIRKEIRFINFLFKKVSGKILFKQIPDDYHPPYYLTSFIKPTTYEFDLYAAAIEQLTLGSLISKSIVPYKENPSYGDVHGFRRLVARHVGTHFDAETVKLCNKVISDIVSCRQGVAHKIGDNKFDQNIDNKRREHNENIWNLLHGLRRALEIEVGETLADRFIDEGAIHNY